MKSHVIIIIILEVFIAYVKNVPMQNSETSGVCSTQGCERAASLLKSNIDETQTPCDDFYKFACGGFIKKSTIPNGANYVNRILPLQGKVYAEIKKSLEEKIDEKQPRIFKLVKNHYQACTKPTSSEDRGQKILMKHIEALGGWPVMSEKAWNATQFNIFETDYKFRKIGYTPKIFFKFDVFNDPTNVDKLYLLVAPPKTTLSYDVLKNGIMLNSVEAYHKFMVDIAVLFGADRTVAYSNMLKVLEFEKAIAAGADLELLGEREVKSIGQLEKERPFIPWQKYINHLTEPIYHFDKSSEIILTTPKYLISLEHQLSRFPKKVIANFMIWKMIEESIPYLNEKVRDRLFAFRQALTGDSGLHRKPRWKECIDLITGSDLMVGVSSMYVREHFNNTNTRQHVKQVLESVINSFKYHLQHITWMDKASRAAATRKCDLMRHIIGYPNELLNDQTIDEYAKSLELSPTDHFSNFIRLQRFHFDNRLLILAKQNKDYLMWTKFSDSTTINAYYYIPRNTFVLLAALMQPPIFDPTWPTYAQYGSIGFIIAHEIMHAYDTTSFKYDEKGNLNYWMSNSSKEEYAVRLLCILDQYQAYRDTEKGLLLQTDGTATLDEDLADNGALVITYDAYKNWVRDHGEDPPLPGLKYTAEQLFWMSTVNFLCAKSTAEHRSITLLFDEHSPEDIRVLGAFSNRPEFAKAFGCTPGSRMNPKNKCEFW